MKRFMTVTETFLKRCVTVGLKRFMKKIRERGDLVKETGIYRELNQGKLNIPKSLRKSLGWHKDTPIEMFLDGGSLILRKYEPGCTFCGDVNNLYKIHERWVCETCVLELHR